MTEYAVVVVAVYDGVNSAPQYFYGSQDIGILVFSGLRIPVVPYRLAKLLPVRCDRLPGINHRCPCGVLRDIERLRALAIKSVVPCDRAVVELDARERHLIAKQVVLLILIEREPHVIVGAENNGVAYACYILYLHTGIEHDEGLDSACLRLIIYSDSRSLNGLGGHNGIAVVRCLMQVDDISHEGIRQSVVCRHIQRQRRRR